MCQLTEMLRRAKVDELISYLIYDTGANSEMAENYEQMINDSFIHFFEKLESLFPEVDREEDEVFSIVADLVTVHDDIYFSSGLLVGFQLYKNMEQSFENSKEFDMKDLLEGVKRKKRSEVKGQGEADTP